LVIIHEYFHGTQKDLKVSK